MLFRHAAVLLQGTFPALPEHRIANIFKPLATPAQSEYRIALFVLGITAAIFAVVAGLLIYALVCFRRKPGDDVRAEPPQVYGSGQIELAWTVIPILIVFVLVGVTGRVIASVQDMPPPASSLRVTVIGRQWWWEIRYPDLGIVTANELHVPVSSSAGDRPTFLRLESLDVIHSFWVPQLGGKTDLIPNRVNSTWIDPREPGLYLGNCAEYCGTQHANMLIRVIVHPGGDFDKWVAAQQQPATDDPEVQTGKQAFQTCMSCHAVQGTLAKGSAGPDLTHLMSRQTIGAGVVMNTAANLRAWVDNPQAVKPGCLMPRMGLTNQQLDAVVSYLQSLK
jgi:cytochrome c oxidase subunit II